MAEDYKRAELSSASQMVPPAGIEPTTFWTGTKRSIQLSYEGKIKYKY